jgi:hypothetical protein
MNIREKLIASGALVPADKVPPKPYVPIDVGVPLLRLLGTERWQATKHTGVVRDEEQAPR